MKRIPLFLTLIIAMGLMLAACGGKDKPDATPNQEPSLSVKEMVEQMIEKVEQPALIELEKDMMKDFYPLDIALLDEFEVRMPMMNVKTNEIAIFKVKDTKDIATVETAAKQRAADVQKQFETYLQDQYENAKNYKIVTKGSYVFFVISESADELIKQFNSYFE